MTQMAVSFTDHSPDRVFVGAVQFVAHECRPSPPGYPNKFIGSLWVQPVADIGPLSASVFYNFPYSADSDQLSDAPLPVPFSFPSPYARDHAGQFHPALSGPGLVEIDEVRTAMLYRSLEEALAAQDYLNRWLRQRGNKGNTVILATRH